jgi:primosomal protein N''
MIEEIYLNRAIAYLKYAYSLTCQTKSSYEMYEEHRENIISCKELVSEDVSKYFELILSKIIKLKRQEDASTVDLFSKETIHDSLKNQEHKLLNCRKHYVQLVLHTSNVENFLDLNKNFA